MLLSSQNLDTKTIAEKYVLLKKKQIGTGAFATVFEGFVKGNAQEKVAIKILQSLPKDSTNKTIETLKILYQREREIHKQIDSENVVKMIDVIQCDQSTYLILEFCEEGNLNKILNRQPKRRFNQERAYQIFCQIVEGYKSLYKLKTLHRDLKPENILFSKGVAKIADFGFAKIIEEMDLAADQTVVGTLLYQAPEMMVSSKYSSKVDIWSLGVIFYEMLYGTTPFNEQHPNKLHKKITTEPLKFPQDVQINESYINLLKKMLKVDPEMRIRWDEIFLLLSKDQNNQIITDENFSVATTHMSDSDRFQTNYKKVEQQINKIDEIKDYFDYVQRIFSFSNNNTARLFFTLPDKLQISPSQQLLFSITSTKYLLNQYNFYIQILLGQLPPSEINFKENDIKTFQSDQAKYYSVLNYLKTNHETMNQFYNEKLLPQFIKLKQADNTNQLIKIIDELVQTNQRNKKSWDSFNKVYMYFIAEITKSIKSKQITDEATLRQIYTLQINMFFSLHPLKFIQNEFEPKNLENELIQSSTQKLENKVTELNIIYSAVVK
ncbi:unnamed protein product [Paramecium pentaurelia]|uniref:Protein kinase domain-containing protein n=1 Tax=Paramecium pentaurelia TaxID=43138 RepID=A0A8S1Y667_9CILI|nr:unnamed protein product [Paramecium pentaurelia]